MNIDTGSASTSGAQSFPSHDRRNGSTKWFRDPRWKVIDRASPPSTSSPLVGPTSHTTSLAHKSGVPIDVMFRLNRTK